MKNNHTNFRFRYVLSASVRRISPRVSAVQRNWTTVTEGSWALIGGDSRTNGPTIDFRPKNIERNNYVHTGCSKSLVRVSLIKETAKSCRVVWNRFRNRLGFTGFESAANGSIVNCSVSSIPIAFYLTRAPRPRHVGVKNGSTVFAAVGFEISRLDFRDPGRVPVLDLHARPDFSSVSFRSAPIFKHEVNHPVRGNIIVYTCCAMSVRARVSLVRGGGIGVCVGRGGAGENEKPFCRKIKNEKGKKNNV